MTLARNVLLVAGCLTVVGCGGSSAPTPVGPLSLTPEQTEAIAQEDTRVQQEEGAAFVARLAKMRKK